MIEALPGARCEIWMSRDGGATRWGRRQMGVPGDDVAAEAAKQAYGEERGRERSGGGTASLRRSGAQKGALLLIGCLCSTCTLC